MLTRSAGVLLHPTSLPSGRLDADAYRFADLIADAGFAWWQVLPLSPPGPDGSPYAARSAFAGSVQLLSSEPVSPASPAEAQSYRAFRAAASAWLDDWALFSAVRDAQDDAPWWDWPESLRNREPGALSSFLDGHADAVEAHRLAQWRFDQEWGALRTYAARRGVRIIGDIPIWVSLDSAEVWARRGLFKLGEDGMPSVVAGVPPDMFSKTGQRWGNPIYNWEAMRRDGYAWWVERVRWAMRTVDLIRIDHFRGFAASWEIPVESEGAIHGTWVDGPGRDLFDAVAAALGTLPFIVEDLGIITPDVEELRDTLGLPGMAILQYAFDGEPKNPYIPHNLIENQVVYTGTHDNQTTAGWLASADDATRARFARYVGHGDAGVDDLVRMALAAPSQLAILPMQDILGLDDSARMNTPASTEGNWQWRFAWEQVDPARMAALARLLEQAGRAAGHAAHE